MCPLDRRAHSSPDMLTPWEWVAHGGRTSGVDGGLDSPVSDTGDLGCFGGGEWDWDGVEGAVVVEAPLRGRSKNGTGALAFPAWLVVIR